MRVLITGGSGQLGTELLKRLPEGAEVFAPTRDELDLSNASAVEAYARQLAPTHILHAGAWTAVDAAESQPDAARAVNALSTSALAKVARQQKAVLLYVSTDFVFGDGHDRPIDPDEPTDPLSVYGMTKFEGECEVQERLGDQCIIVRTSWVYAAHGQNFVRTMLRLMNERERLQVVADQVGTPTSAADLAEFCWKLLVESRYGIWHFSDAGVASWYDFACAIYEEARARGLVTQDVEIRPIPSEGYPTPAYRPRYSVLDKHASWALRDTPPEHWRAALRRVLDALM